MDDCPIKVDFAHVHSFDQVQLDDWAVENDGIDDGNVRLVVVLGAAQICAIIQVVQAAKSKSQY